LHDVSPAYSREFGLVDARPVDQRENGVLSDCHGVCRGERRESQTLLGRRVESVIHAFENTGSRARCAATLGNRAIKPGWRRFRRLRLCNTAIQPRRAEQKLLTTPCLARAKRGTMSEKSTDKTIRCVKPITRSHLRSEGRIR